jgi:hypothetical protein
LRILKLNDRVGHGLFWFLKISMHDEKLHLLILIYRKKHCHQLICRYTTAIKNAYESLGPDRELQSHRLIIPKILVAGPSNSSE